MSGPPDLKEQFARSPIITTLAIVAFINWLVYFGISDHFGGKALGVRPSVDGFVLKQHGHTTAVTEKVWLFSLIYTSATLLVTPGVLIAMAAYQGALRNVSRVKRWLLLSFICVLGLGWYGGITKSFLVSLQDYRGLKHVMPLEK